MRRPEIDLEQVLAAAFDRLAEPDATKLQLIEERLDRTTRRVQGKRRSRGMYWWLVAGLVATGAAAWWVGERYFDKASMIEPPPAVIHEPDSVPVPPPVSEQQRGVDASKTESGTSSRRSTVYQREKF